MSLPYRFPGGPHPVSPAGVAAWPVKEATVADGLLLSFVFAAVLVVWHLLAKRLKAVPDAGLHCSATAGRWRAGWRAAPNPGGGVALHATAAGDYYEVLGVDRWATAEECKVAFRRRVKGYQDVYRALGTEEDVAAVQLLLRAYQVLSDPALRERYDAGLGSNDPFEEPETVPTEVFVDPWGCANVSITEWRLLQDVAQEALATEKAPDEVLRAKGAACPPGACHWVTPAQRWALVAELEQMDEDFDYDWHETSVRLMLLRARWANRLGPWQT
eukprot:EG_transcript_20516